MKAFRGQLDTPAFMSVIGFIACLVFFREIHSQEVGHQHLSPQSIQTKIDSLSEIRTLLQNKITR